MQVKIECTYLRQEKRRGRASEKYPKQIKKKKHKDDSINDLVTKTKSKVLLLSKKPERNYISHGMVDMHPSLDRIPSNRLLLNAPPDFYLGTTRFPILVASSNELKRIGMPYEVADELFQYYFDSHFQPVSKVFSVLRRIPMLQSKRSTQSNLLLSIILSSAVQTDHRFFAGSNRDFACQALYQMIQELLPTLKSEFTFDDFLCVIHLGFVMPWLSYPVDSLYWWRLGIDTAQFLNLSEIRLNDTNDAIEERTRGWWSLYILDRLTSLAFNEAISIPDAECDKFYLPCDETTWNETDELITNPLYDPLRIKSINFDYVTDGIYGWTLNLCSLMGKYTQYRNCKDPTRKAHLRELLIQLESKNLQSVMNFQSTLNPNDIRRRNSTIDTLYAKYINLVLLFIIRNDTDQEMLGSFDPSTSTLQFQRLAQCIETLEEILKLDENLYRYPFFSSFFVFLIGVSLLSTLNSITNTDHSNITKINNYKYYVKTLVRVIEGILTGFPAEFLRTIRNQLGLSIKDCEHLILLTDYIQVFRENVRKRKEALKAYSWAENGRGIAV